MTYRREVPPPEYNPDWLRRELEKIEQALAIPRYHLFRFNRSMDAASGVQNVTGLKFKPQALIATGAVSAGGLGTRAFSIGFGEVGNNMCSYNYNTNTFFPTTQLIRLAEDASDSIMQTAIVTAFHNDGYQLTWTKVGSPVANTAVIGIIALG